MATWEIKNVKLIGVSAAVPSNIVKTNDFDFFTTEEADTFGKTVGIKQRRIASDNICASDMCQAAAEQLLTDIGWSKDSIDVLLFESVTGDYRTPPTSCILQDKLVLPETCFCMDIPMGCCGCMYAINIAGNLLSSGTAKRALLLVGDTAMRMGSLKDKSRVPLFGDCGTAIALEYVEGAKDIILEFNTLGSGYEALMTPHGGARHPITLDSFEYQDFGNGIVRAPMHSLINGMNVFSFAISRPPKSFAKFIDTYQIDKDKVDFFLIHQANKMIVDRIVKKLQLPIEKVPYNLEEFGNLGGASIPSLMVTRISDELTSGKEINLLCSSFGLGLSWATMMLKCKDVVVSKLVEI